MKTNSHELPTKLYSLAEELKRSFFEDKLSTKDVKLITLQGDTARAMHREVSYREHKPSSIFKNWVHFKFFEDNYFQKAILDEGNFENIHQESLDSLRRHWFEIEPAVKTTMPIHLFYKMIDLLMKSICRWTDLNSNRREWFFKNAHVPLDKYSLKALSKYHDDYVIKHPTMGYVKSADLYFKIQKDIKELVDPHPPLLFDLFAWDHEKGKEKQKPVSFDLVKAKRK